MGVCVCVGEWMSVCGGVSGWVGVSGCGCVGASLRTSLFTFFRSLLRGTSAPVHALGVVSCSAREKICVIYKPHSRVLTAPEIAPAGVLVGDKPLQRLLLITGARRALYESTII